MSYFSKYIDLKWGSGKHAPLSYEEKSIVFIDNKFSNCFEQIKFFFESGFLCPTKTVLVCKFYKNNYYEIKNAAKKINLEVCFYLFYRQIPNLNGRLIFYPYNAQSNCRLLLNRKALHIFLTHGESNKKASVNRMVRMYDYILSAGDFSSDRYVENKVLSKADIADGRVIKMGGFLIAPCFKSPTENVLSDYLVYMPTWEGGLDDEDFSSIACDNVLSVLVLVANKLKINKVIIRPHPNTGARKKIYKKKLIEIVKKLRQEKMEVFSDDFSLNHFFCNRNVSKFISLAPENCAVRYGLVDVSAAEFMLAANKIPSAVLWKKNKEFCASKKYLDLRRESLLNVQGDDYFHAVNYIYSENDLISQSRFFNVAISYINECLEEMSPINAGDWLRAFLFEKLKKFN